jgi:hypothetical protein
MPARTLIDELKRRLGEIGVAPRERSETELDFALIERIYGIAPTPAPAEARPPRRIS